MTFTVNLKQFDLPPIADISNAASGQLNIPLNIGFVDDPDFVRTLQITLSNNYQGPGAINYSVDGDAAGGWTLHVTLPTSYDGSAFNATVSASVNELPDEPSQEQSFQIAGLQTGMNIPGSVFQAPTDGTQLAIPIAGTDAPGQGLTYSVTSDTPGLTFTWEQQQPVVYAKLTFDSTHLVDNNGDGIPETLVDDGTLGTIYVMLYKSLAPAAVQRFIDLAQEAVVNGKLVAPDSTHPAFYTNVPVYGVVPGEVFLTGDAVKGDGTGSSGLGDINTSFETTTVYKNLSFAGSGVLAMANNGGDGTGDCRFFITQEPVNASGYAIFGQMISGWDTLNAIIDRPADASGKPVAEPRLKSVQIINSSQNNQDAVLMVSADKNFTGPAQVQITVTDSSGTAVTKTISILAKSSVNQLQMVNTVSDGSDNLTNQDLSAYQPEIEMRFESTNPTNLSGDQSAPDSQGIVVRTADSYVPDAGGSDVQIKVRTISDNYQGKNKSLAVYMMQVELPSDYSQNLQPFWIWVWTQSADGGNVVSPVFQFYVSCLGASRPTFDTLTLTDASGNTSADQTAVTSNVAYFKLNVADDQVVHSSIQIISGMTGTVQEPTVTNDSGIFTITAPNGFYGVVTVNVTVREEQDVNNVLDQTTNTTQRPKSQNFNIVFAPNTPGPTQVVQPQWHLDDTAVFSMQTDDFLFVGTPDQGLEVYKNSDLTTNNSDPTPVGAWNPSSSTSLSINDMKLLTYQDANGPYQVLLLAAGAQGLVSLRINPTDTTNVLQYLDTFSMDADSVTVEDRSTTQFGSEVDRIAYVGTPGQGLYMLDVTNPKVLGHDPTPNATQDARKPLRVIVSLYPSFATSIKYENFPQCPRI